MIAAIITTIYSILLLWAVIAVIQYQNALSKGKGETLVVIRIAIILPFVLLALLAYGSLFIQPMIYSWNTHVPGNFDIKAALRTITMVVETVAIIFYPMYAWADTFTFALNREIRNSEADMDGLRQQTNSLRNMILITLVLGTIILIFVRK